MILNAEQLMIRDMARRFAVEQLAPFAGEWDRECTFPAAAIREMGELGLLGMLIPQNWDGAGADHGVLRTGAGGDRRGRRRHVDDYERAEFRRLHAAVPLRVGGAKRTLAQAHGSW